MQRITLPLEACLQSVIRKPSQALEIRIRTQSTQYLEALLIDWWWNKGFGLIHMPCTHGNWYYGKHNHLWVLGLRIIYRKWLFKFWACLSKSRRCHCWHSMLIPSSIHHLFINYLLSLLEARYWSCVSKQQHEVQCALLSSLACFHLLQHKDVCWCKHSVYSMLREAFPIFIQHTLFIKEPLYINSNKIPNIHWILHLHLRLSTKMYSYLFLLRTCWLHAIMVPFCSGETEMESS